MSKLSFKAKAPEVREFIYMQDDIKYYGSCRARGTSKTGALF